MSGFIIQISEEDLEEKLATARAEGAAEACEMICAMLNRAIDTGKPLTAKFVSAIRARGEKKP